MRAIDVFQPDDLTSSIPPVLSGYGWRFLAQGDSWFTIGTLNLLANSNLLFELRMQQSACAVTCATPGDTLRRMSQMNADRNFTEMLCGHRSRFWDGILMSCGGNDLIEAVAAPAVDEHGDPIPQDRRLLLTRDEWGPPARGALRYLSESGWQTFRSYFLANLEHFLAMRDAGPSKGQPLFLHGYAFPTPRPAGAGLGMGPWLYPSLQAYAIPGEDGIAVARELLLRLGALLRDAASDSARFPAVHFFDSTGVAIEAAANDAPGVSGDWVNEIHLTRSGYSKIAVVWSAEIEAILRGD